MATVDTTRAGQTPSNEDHGQGSSNENQGEQRQSRGILGNLTQVLFQVILIQTVVKLLGFGQNRSAPPVDPVTGEPEKQYTNYFLPDSQFDLFVHLVDVPDQPWQEIRESGTLLWSLRDLRYSHHRHAAEKMMNVSVLLTDDQLSGKHIPYLSVSAVSFDSYTRRGVDLESSGIPDSPVAVVHGFTPLTEIMEPLTHDESLHSLIGRREERLDAKEDLTAASRKAENETAEVPHWKKRADIRAIYDSSTYTSQSLRANPLTSQIRVFPEQSVYHPVIHASDFWLIEKDYMPLNISLKGRPTEILLTYSTMPHWTWVLQSHLKQSWTMQSAWGMHTRKEAFMMKRILLETNPFMLVFSGAFILLHSLFSILAFKNDVQFWYNNESMQGLSAMSILFSFACEIVIGLYLFDSEDTSYLILFEIFMGIVISAWKVTRAVKVSLCASFPFISLTDAKNYKESKTKEYDAVAIKFMSILLMPCVAAYAFYALNTYRYRSWYSFTVSVLAGTVYTFGFIMMTPQLYINYKLKSVDHLPWKPLVYRALNTFVDDIAAFIIDMPWMHRLACFRDDIVFLLYLYQRYIYRVDKTRSQWGPVDGEHPQSLTSANEVETTVAGEPSCSEIHPSVGGIHHRSSAGSGVD